MPPANALEKVTIGSSSLSMYPGYSPADHLYGEAAQEFGQEWSEAKKQGAKFQLAENGPQYEFGQSGKRRKKSIEETRADLAAREAAREALRAGTENGQRPVNGSGSGGRYDRNSHVVRNGLEAGSHVPSSEGEAAWKARAAMGRNSESSPPSNQKQQQANEKRLRAKRVSPDARAESPESDSNGQPAFFIDTNPTPVNAPAAPPVSRLKRAASEEDDNPKTTDEVTAPKTKKSKKAKLGQNFAEPAPLSGDADAVESSTIAPPSNAPVEAQKPEPRIEFEDITAEVDARVAAREERRKRKHEKKRKRESEGENANPPAADATGEAVKGISEESAQATEEKPKKKKSKKRTASNEGTTAVDDITTGSVLEVVADVVPAENGTKADKKRKNTSEEEGQEPVEEGKKKKKSKKGKDKSAA